MITTGMNTMDRVLLALENNGYLETNILSCNFLGTIDSNFHSCIKEVHRITYKDEDSVDEGRVYVWWNGKKLVADF